MWEFFLHPLRFVSGRATQSDPGSQEDQLPSQRSTPYLRSMRQTCWIRCSNTKHSDSQGCRSFALRWNKLLVQLKYMMERFIKGGEEWFIRKRQLPTIKNTSSVRRLSNVSFVTCWFQPLLSVNATFYNLLMTIYITKSSSTTNMYVSPVRLKSWVTCPRGSMLKDQVFTSFILRHEPLYGGSAGTQHTSMLWEMGNFCELISMFLC